MPEMQSTPTSLPPWVHFDSTGGDATVESSASSSSHPTSSASAPTPPRSALTSAGTRHDRPSSNPSAGIRHAPTTSHFKPGRKWDALRTAEPALLSEPIGQEQVRWIPFMQSGPNPQFHPFGHEREARIVDEHWMEANMPHMMAGWRPEDEELVENQGRESGPKGFQGIMYRGKWLISPERQERTVRLFWRLLLKNAFVPLIFRVTVLAFSATALGIAAAIYVTIHKVNGDADILNQCQPRASMYMAIVVGSIAIPYVGYITWDEYMSKPLGMRSLPAKTLLLLCDLYFIVFAASNVSLAFDALYDKSWACYTANTRNINGAEIALLETCPDNSEICYKQGALSGVLLVALCAWLLCFGVSVMRVVEKLRVD